MTTVESSPRTRRGQATLAALVAALVVLTATVGVSLALADAALASADRDPTDRRAALAASERLVVAESPLTRRANVVNASSVSTLTPDRLVEVVPSLAGTAFRVDLGGETLVERGDPSGGVTVRRIVLVASADERTRQVNATRSVTLPRRTDRVSVDATNGSVETVRANGRVVLHRPGGIAGTSTVTVSRRETLTLAFDANATGTVVVTYWPEQTRKTTLAVTVDV